MDRLPTLHESRGACCSVAFVFFRSFASEWGGEMCCLKEFGAFRVRISMVQSLSRGIRSA